MAVCENLGFRYSGLTSSGPEVGVQLNHEGIPISICVVQTSHHV